MFQVVIGSVNLDFSLKMKRFPNVGETLTDAELHISPGGKGLNQAVSSARAGVKTFFVFSSGDDVVWEMIKKYLKNEKNLIPIRFKSKNLSTGIAIIMVDKKGENKIVVSPGANREKIEVEKIIKRLSPPQVLLQCEISREVLQSAILTAKNCGSRVILNNAPYKDVKKLVKYIDILIMNEIEAQKFFGNVITRDGRKIEKIFSDMGGKDLLITLGKRGVYFKGKIFPAFKVNSVDTVGAGDVFVGYFSALILKRVGAEKAIILSSAAAALSTTRYGAYTSIPSLDEVKKFISKRKKY